MSTNDNNRLLSARTGIRIRVEGMRVLHDGPLHYTSVSVLATDLSYLAITHSIIRFQYIQCKINNFSSLSVFS